MSATSVGTVRPLSLPDDAPEVIDLIVAVNLHDQPGYFPTVEGLLNDWAPGPTFDPATDLRGLEVDGKLVGVARHSWRDRPAVVNHRLEIWVHHQHRRHGLGTRLLAWAEERARASVDEGRGGPADKPHQFGGAGPQGLPAVPGFAAARGYEPYRYHFEMRRDLAAAIPDAPVPEGLEVRPVEPAHYRAIFEADEEAFRDHWDHAATVEGDFERFIGDPDLDPTLWQVAWDADEVAGFVLNTIYARENELRGLQAGWLEGVATRRPWRGRGVAGALIALSLAILRERGMAVAGLGVDAENPTGALGLYERFGFRPVKTWAFYRKPF